MMEKRETLEEEGCNSKIMCKRRRRRRMMGRWR
jgi:hypothetical protein